MNRKFDLIIFDWDGTIVNSIDWIVDCLQSAAKACECRIPEVEAAKNVIGLSIERAMDELLPELNAEERTQFVGHYSQRFFSKSTGTEDLFTGVGDMLENLKQQGYLLAVATGKKSTGLAKAMRGTGLEDVFHVTRGADQTASKPNPLMINEILAHLSVEKDKALMVGDSIHDLQMAANAEVAAVGVTCGAHSEVILQQYGPMACLQHTRDIMNIID